MARLASSLVAGVLGFGVVACSWTRFDDVQEDAPVLLLNKPDNVGYGFGSTVAAGEVDGFYRVFVGASPGRTGGAEFELGPKQGASTDAARSGHCDVGCTLAKTAASMQRADLDGLPRTLCVAEGLGTADGSKPLGVQIQCDAGDSAFLSANALPAGVVVDEPGKQLSLVAEDGDFPILMAGATGLSGAPGKAWFYASSSQTPVELDAGVSVGETYGAALVVVKMKGAAWLAVGEPGAGRVFLFDDQGTLAGCLFPPGANTQFGRTLAAGRIDGDSDEELIVADGQKAHVLSGAVLAANSNAACADLPAGAEIVALACRTTADLDGCGGSDFGAALAVADLDHDGDGEVLVGAPGMDVRDDASDGGAVFVFDVEPDHPDWVAETRFISSAEAGDKLGTAIGVVHQPDRDVFVAGAPGNGKAALFFCSKLRKSNKGAHCD